MHRFTRLLYRYCSKKCFVYVVLVLTPNQARDQLHYHTQRPRGRLVGRAGRGFYMAIAINDKSPSTGKHVDLKLTAETNSCRGHPKSSLTDSPC